MKLKDIVSNTVSYSEVTDTDIDIDSDDLEKQVDTRKLEHQRYQSDTRDRKWLAIWTAAAVSMWLLAVLLILAFNNIGNLKLSDSVLSILLGTTTLNVLGLSFIVLRGHFLSARK